MVSEFDDIRPYNDSEISDAMNRIINDPIFDSIVAFIYPGVPVADIRAKFSTFRSVKNFQVNVMNSTIQNIVKNTSSGFSYNGLDFLSTDKRYLFISNHRDILLDSALLQVILNASNHETSEITFGDNLMSSPFVVDIGKSNKMFRLVRGGSPKEIFCNSMLASRYIRYAINEKKQSIWIAQRNGRTKDGDDQTQQAVLKMFGMSSCLDFADNFAELNLVPVSISYEYDPCDTFKTRELYISRRQSYVKTDGEDLNSIIHGIKQYKGKIHLSITKPVSIDELREIENAPKNDRMAGLAGLIDKRIYENFKLWGTNYIAYDLLHGDRFKKEYTLPEKEAFLAYMNKSLSGIEGDKAELESIFLRIYSNPVVNHYKHCTHGQQKEIKLLKFECA
jgi:hypothetical protein